MAHGILRAELHHVTLTTMTEEKNKYNLSVPDVQLDINQQKITHHI